MAEIMRDIAKAMSTMPTAEKLAFAEDIFDIRGSLAGLTLTANTDELDTMLVKLQDVEGVAADTAKKMDAGLGGAFRLLLSAVEGAMNAIADAMNSTLQPLIVKVTAVINAFTQWIEANRGAGDRLCRDGGGGGRPCRGSDCHRSRRQRGCGRNRRSSDGDQGFHFPSRGGHCAGDSTQDLLYAVDAVVQHAI